MNHLLRLFREREVIIAIWLISLILLSALYAGGIEQTRWADTVYLIQFSWLVIIILLFVVSRDTDEDQPNDWDADSDD